LHPLDSRLRLRPVAVMPANQTTTPVALAARLSRLAVEAQWVADRLVARPFEYGDAAVLMSGPAQLFASLWDCLEDAMYRAEKLDQRHADQDLVALREIARAHSSEPI
jgi:hypothetical protein